MRQLSQTYFTKHELICHKQCIVCRMYNWMLNNFTILAGTKLCTLHCTIQWCVDTIRLELMKTEHDDERNEKSRKAGIREEYSVNRGRAQVWLWNCVSSTCWHFAQRTTRRWWITRAITAWVVTALQITGDAAYYTNGGWRVHNVVMHALL